MGGQSVDSPDRKTVDGQNISRSEKERLRHNCLFGEHYRSMVKTMILQAKTRPPTVGLRLSSRRPSVFTWPSSKGWDSSPHTENLTMEGLFTVRQYYKKGKYET